MHHSCSNNNSRKRTDASLQSWSFFLHKRKYVSLSVPRLCRSRSSSYSELVQLLWMKICCMCLVFCTASVSTSLIDHSLQATFWIGKLKNGLLLSCSFTKILQHDFSQTPLRKVAVVSVGLHSTFITAFPVLTSANVYLVKTENQHMSLGRMFCV